MRVFQLRADISSSGSGSAILTPPPGVKHDVFCTTRFSSRTEHALIPHNDLGSLEPRFSDVLLAHNSLFLSFEGPGEPGERVLRSGDFRVNRL